MRSIRTAIRQHRGPVLVRTEILLSGQGLAAADQVHHKLSSETPPAGWVGITKAAAYRLLDTPARVYTWENAGAIGLEVERTPAAGKTQTEVAEETYRTMFQPEDQGNHRAKPPNCSQGYGSCIPKYTYAPGRHRCGISGTGQCPVEKSINRARSKARKRILGLWKRSRRVYRRRLEAQAVEMEYPIRYLGLLPAITGYPDSARVEPGPVPGTQEETGPQGSRGRPHDADPAYAGKREQMTDEEILEDIAACATCLHDVAEMTLSLAAKRPEPPDTQRIQGDLDQAQRVLEWVQAQRKETERPQGANGQPQAAKT